jgi:fucose permease
LRPDFTTVGAYFLSINAGIVLSVPVARWLLPRKGIGFSLMLACGIAAASFLSLALASSPDLAAWRPLGLFGIGFGDGLLNAAVLQAISPLYQRDRPATINMAGIFFGSGCLVTALLVAGTYYVYTVPSILILLAAIPGLYIMVYLRARFSEAHGAQQFSIQEVAKDFRSPGAILFTLLLFFQFGNEWSLAGWLPLFLIRRLGISPATSLMLLALFWAALLIGRLATQIVRQRLSHGSLLMGSVLSALLGCIILDSTANQFGAVMGILFVGFGFASIYPLVLEKIANRFPHYHPGFYHGIFSLAFTGGLLAPWTLGYFADAWGIRAVMVLPLLGTCVVVLLLLLIMLEAKLNGMEEVREAGA